MSTKDEAKDNEITLKVVARGATDVEILERVRSAMCDWDKLICVNQHMDLAETAAVKTAVAGMMSLVEDKLMQMGHERNSPDLWYAAGVISVYAKQWR